MPEPSLDEARYSLEQVKAAFWATFHKAGEQWFNYLGSDTENEQSTISGWEGFLDHLQSPGSTPAGEGAARYNW